MKTKFSRMLGVALTIAMVASLFVFAIPVAAQPGETVWATQTIPTATGNVILNASDIGDITIADDGTIYIINNDNGVDAATAGSVLSSTDGGQSFTALANVAGVAGRFLNAIAVAPDNSSVVLVTDGFDCYLSTDAGSTWTTLGTDAVAGPGGFATNEILDVDVSSAIPGALFGRHYVRAVADGAATVTASEAQLMGVRQTDWTSTAAGTNGDYLAVKFSPNYMGDRALAVLYNTGTDTFFDIISQPEAAGETLTQTCDITPITSLDWMVQDTGLAVAGSITVGDIALPYDWDPSLTSGQVSYISVGTETTGLPGAGVADRGAVVAITTGTASDDVYRIDANAAIALNGVTSLPVHSIAYNGTIADGTLFLGERCSTNVKWTLNPTSSAPTWTSTSKAPTGDNTALPENCTVISIAPDGNIYAGTRDIWWSVGSDQRSAFSVSTDDAVTFNQTAIIDVGQVSVWQIDSVMLTPDAGTVFMGTDDTTDLSLWKSATETGSTTWERIYCRTAAGPGIVRLAPDYADNPSIFWADTAAANLWTSHDGGVIFSNRTPPATIQDLTVEAGGSAGVLYMANGTDVYKSTNGGYWFGLAQPAEANAVISLAMAPSYPALPVAGNLLVGGTGACSYSTDSAASFTAIDGGLAGASTFIINADEGYADNNIIYCGDSLAAGTANTFRYEIGVSTAWDDMLTAAVAATDEVLGLGMNNGVLYSLSAAVWGVERALHPLDPLGLIVWDTGNTGVAAPGALTVAAQPNILTAADNFLYFPDRTLGTPVLWALQDTMATVVPVISAPADGATIIVDPVTGYGMLTTVAWGAIGSGGGLVNEYELQSDDASGNWIGTTQFVAGVAVGQPLTPSWTVGDPVSAVATGARPSWGANQMFQLRVRCRDTVNNGGLRSNWSDVISVSIEAGVPVVAPQVGPVLQGPTGGATGVSLNPGFSWTPLSGATEYEFILALDAGLTLTVEDTPVYVNQPSWQVPAGTLETDTQYFWGVKVTQPTESPQSIGTFRTLVPGEYICPFCGEIFNSVGGLDSHIAAAHPAGTPAYMWAIIIIGAVLMIAVIMLIMKTRRVA